MGEKTSVENGESGKACVSWGYRRERAKAHVVRISCSLHVPSLLCPYLGPGPTSDNKDGETGVEWNCRSK